MMHFTHGAARLALVAGCLAVLIGAAPAPAAPAPEKAPPAQKATIKVQADQPGAKVPKTLYGIFFEEINHAGDGGLYAELVRNRSFEDADKLDPWTLVTPGTRTGQIALDKEKPMSEKNPTSLRLRIGAAGEGRVGAANPGFWGIAVKKGSQYRLSFHARAADGFAGPLVVTLESADGGKKYAEAKIAGIGPDWTPAATTLTASDTDPSARLVIAADKPGTVWLDVVSLFPKDTWEGRENGLRADLAGMLAAMRPAFVRFPGGCWVEGDTLQFATRWKKTIGDAADRWNQWNRWGYWSTNGLGFHEYLQMCEDLGAEPLFVINCGMSHKENVPMDKMPEWVQDALDAIEYCNGPADSKWGGLRAKAGHPAPFNLKYMEIGNENHGPAYEERYALFHDAIKAKYPEMRLVADGRIASRPMDIVDEHFYNSPEFFMSQARRYDRYDRAGPKIYVGEFAVTRGASKGSLRGAIGEAAFMTGFERNADVVIMSSYAPLFVNVNDRKWNPDLIQFDSSRVAGIPSYHVQKLFATNRPDVVLPVEVQAAAQVQAAPAPHGAVGVGTWRTQAEFKDIKVADPDGKTLFQCDFSKGANGWKTSEGKWAVKDGAFQQTDGGTNIRAVAGDTKWTDYAYTLKARKLGGAEGFLILFHVADQNNWAWWNVGGWGNVRHGIEMATGGAKHAVGSEARGRIETGRWYDIRIEVRGPSIRCFLDGKRIHDVTDVSGAGLAPLYACAGRDEAAGEIVLKVVNASESAQETDITLAGAKVEPKGKAIVLTSASPADENTLDEPMRVAPVEKAIENAGPTFRHAFPPNSLTILRLKESK
jgi:alpha-L-arabinofuranosidase